MLHDGMTEFGQGRPAAPTAIDYRSDPITGESNPGNDPERVHRNGMTTHALMTVGGIGKALGDQRVLDDVSFEVASGELPSGARVGCACAN
jgi:hypothetical protein